MRKQFTVSYLNDAIDPTKKGRNTIRNQVLIPPTDPIDPLNAILDAEIMSEYYMDYNNERKAYQSNLLGNVDIKNVPHLVKSIRHAKDIYYKKGCIV